MVKNRQLFRLISLYHLRRHPLRTLLSLLGMTLGAAFMFVGLAAIPGQDQAFNQGIDLINGRAQVDIWASADGVKSDLLATVRQTEGVTVAAPLVLGGGLVLGQTELMVFWGIDPVVDGQVRTYALAQGNFPARPGDVLLTERYAAEKGYRVGQAISLVGPGGIRPLTITGTLAASGIAILNGGDLIVLPVEDAQALRGSSVLNAIGVIPTPNQNVEALVTRLKAVLPDTVTIRASQMRTAKTPVNYVAQFLLVFMALLPAALGAALIFNTQAATVAQRRTEIGILRALGLTRAGVRTLFVFESAVLGLIGSLLGLILGYVLVQWTGDLTTSASGSTVTVQGLRIAAGVVIPVWLPIVTLIVSTAIAVIAGVRPARQAARVDPVEAIARVPMDSGAMRLSILRLLLGVLLLGLALVVRLASDNSEQATFMPMWSILLTVPGSVLLFPPLIIALGKWLPGPLGRFFGTGGFLAAQSFAQRPRHIAAIGIMIFLVIWLVAMSGSLDKSQMDFVKMWLAGEGTWDLTVTGPGTGALTPVTHIPASALAEILARPTVAAAVQERQAETRYDHHKYFIRALDIATFRAQGGRIPRDSGDEEAAYARLLDPAHPALLVGGFQALKDGLMQPGKHIVLLTPSGPVDFEIVGVILATPATLAEPAGAFVMDRALYSRLWQDSETDRLLIRLQPGADIQAERRDLLRRYALSGLLVTDSETLRAAVAGASVIPASVAYGLVLPFMMLGIANTLFIAVLDRRREIGLLRAIGTLRRHIVLSVVLEALILIGLTCIFAVPSAFYTLDIMLFRSITGIPITADVGSVATTVILVLVAGAIAAYLPARRAGRVDILEALHYE